MKNIVNIMWSFLMVASYLTFSYYYFNGWWYSSIGTGLILFFSYLLWRKDLMKCVGLHLSSKNILRSIILTVLIILASVLMIKYIGQKNDIALRFTSLRSYYHNVFYILNEEIMLGGIAIYILIKRLNLKPLLASVGLALVFSLVHLVFYKWIFLERGQIEVITLCTLFLVGFVRNNLIISTGHIGYSWALHFGWMVVMFGSFIYHSNTEAGLTEPERFNTFLGSSEMLGIAIVLAVLSLFYMKSDYRNQKD